MDTTGDLTHTLHLPRKAVRRIIDRYRVTDGKDFRLKEFDPADTTGHLLSHAQANALLAESVQRLSDRQESSTHRTAGPCYACCKRWMPPARTARSSM